MVSEGNTRSLNFDAWTGDPLARLVFETLKWKSWQLPILITVAYVMLLGVSVLVYVLRDGGFDFSPFGGYQAFIPGVAVDLIMYLFGTRLYVYFSQKSGTLYQDLADDRVIEQAECRTVVLDGAKSMERLHGNVAWLVWAVTLALVVSAVWFYQYGLDPGRAKGSNMALLWPSY